MASRGDVSRRNELNKCGRYLFTCGCEYMKINNQHSERQS